MELVTLASTNARNVFGSLVIGFPKEQKVSFLLSISPLSQLKGLKLFPINKTFVPPPSEPASGVIF